METIWLNTANVDTANTFYIPSVTRSVSKEYTKLFLAGASYFNELFGIRQFFKGRVYNYLWDLHKYLIFKI